MAFAPGYIIVLPSTLSRIVFTVNEKLSIVEYSPQRDTFDVTAMVAAKFYKELVARLLV